jgi:hypothetical protein
MTLGRSGSALRLFEVEGFALAFFIRALTGARRDVFGGDETSESTALWNVGCFALDIMRWRSSVGLFVFSRVGKRAPSMTRLLCYGWALGDGKDGESQSRRDVVAAT